jgi:hypothetical protein
LVGVTVVAVGDGFTDVVGEAAGVVVVFVLPHPLNINKLINIAAIKTNKSFFI